MVLNTPSKKIALTLAKNISHNKGHTIYKFSKRSYNNDLYSICKTCNAILVITLNGSKYSIHGSCIIDRCNERK